MTHDERTSDAMPSAEHGAIDALLDGEHVDPHVLRDALSHPDVRDYFVDALMLRQLTRDMEPAQVATPAPARTGGALPSPLRWMAAAAVVGLSATGGYFYGQPEQVLVASPMSVEIVMNDTPPPAVPTPTQIIRLEPGVNWTNVNGGN